MNKSKNIEYDDTYMPLMIGIAKGRENVFSIGYIVTDDNSYQWIVLEEADSLKKAKNVIKRFMKLNDEKDKRIIYYFETPIEKNKIVYQQIKPVEIKIN